MIFGSGINTVNNEYSFAVKDMAKVNLCKLYGQEFTIVGFIYKEYTDGIRCFLVTTDNAIIRMPKWFSDYLNRLSASDLEIIKSGQLVITDIHLIPTNKSYFTTTFNFRYKDNKKIFIDADKCIHIDHPEIQEYIEERRKQFGKH